jgi:hypothetical protein
MKYLIFAVFVLQGIALSAHAVSNTCIQSVQEYSEKSSNLPPVLQKLPAMLVTDGLLVTAGIKIRAAGDKLKLEGYVWKPGEILINDGYIQKACFDGASMKVTLENGTTYDAKVKNEESVSIQGVSFDKSTEYKFAGIVEKIKKAQSSRSSTSSSGSSGTSGVQ